jgi:hypothetical protein
MRQRAVRSSVLAGICLIALGCAGCGSSNSNPTPVITALSPQAVPVGNGGFLLAISGTNMNGSSTVVLNGTQLTVVGTQVPACGSATTNCPVILEASVPAGEVNAAGNLPLNVTTSGQHSKTVNLSVVSPQLVTESPMAVPAGSATFPLTLTVLNAAPTVQVNFGALSKTNSPLVPAGPVTCNTATACSVVVNVPSSSVTNAGAVTVTVVNPLATSGGSATTNFMVTAAAGTGKFPLAESVVGGAPGNASSTHSAVSDGGAFVAFDSTATNLTSTPTNGLSQVYLQNDCFTGGTCSAGITLVSGPSGGTGSGGVIGSDKPAISGDGRFVAFESDDTNLVSGTTQPIEQIYLLDTCNGLFGAVKNCTPKMTLVSAGASAPGDGPSTNPAISASGLYIAFQSSATNLTSATVPAGTQQIYLYLTCNGVNGAIAGCTPGIQLLSTDANGNAGDNDSVTPAIDPAGLAVAFESLADNIVSGTASNGARQIYLQTTCLEGVPFLQAPCGPQTVLVSGDTSNRPGVSDSITPTLADNGNLVAVYATSAANILPTNASGQQIVDANVCVTLPSTVPCAATGTRVLSVDQNGASGNGASSNPSAAGARVVFTSLATNLVSGASGQQVYGVTLCVPPATCSATTLISTDSTGATIGGDFGALGGGGFAAFSTTGSAGASGIGEIFLAAPF